MSPVLITLHPARMGLGASKATEHASCTVNGIIYQAESRSGAVCELFRVLMTTNLPDAPWQAYRHDRLVMYGRSVHAMSRRTVADTDKHGPRFTPWKPYPSPKDAESFT